MADDRDEATIVQSALAPAWRQDRTIAIVVRNRVTGKPFNIASYALLTMMVAQVRDLEPGDFVHTLGDAHLYSNHFEQAREQLTRKPGPLPAMYLNPDVADLFAFRYEDFRLEGYDPAPSIRAPIAVRSIDYERGRRERSREELAGSRFGRCPKTSLVYARSTARVEPVLESQPVNPRELAAVGGHEHGAASKGVCGDQQVVGADRRAVALECGAQYPVLPVDRFGERHDLDTREHGVHLPPRSVGPAVLDAEPEFGGDDDADGNVRLANRLDAASDHALWRANRVTQHVRVQHPMAHGSLEFRLVERRQVVVVDVRKGLVQGFQAGEHLEQGALTHGLHDQPIAVLANRRLVAVELEVLWNPDRSVAPVVEQLHPSLDIHSFRRPHTNIG